jgi:hypothetical protein
MSLCDVSSDSDVITYTLTDKEKKSRDEFLAKHRPCREEYAKLGPEFTNMVAFVKTIKQALLAQEPQ